MIQSTQQRAGTTSSLRLWGLTPVEVYDAYWRSLGVQCVRRGEGLVPMAGVDLFLLLEPGQLGLFELGQLLEELTWSGAPLHRIRIVENTEESYHERVVLDDQGRVRRIERRYRSRPVGGLRVLITQSVKLARVWGEARTHREGWTRLRSSVAWTRRNHHRIDGWAYNEGKETDERKLLHRLVQLWPDPARAIEGLEAVQPGVWASAGTEAPEGSTLVGPVWIGRGVLESTSDGAVRVGPEVVLDLDDQARRYARPEAPARVLEIVEIVPGTAHPRTDSPPRGQPFYRTAKRAIDIAVSLAVLLATLPLLAALALLVVVDDGRPIFYGHLRQTIGGRLFRCWKFRTMRRDADRLTKELAALNVCDGPQFFIKDDPRVTRVGRFLRRWHLDELPQFFNVLLGDMSLVGPRPSPDSENQYCPAWRELRLSVRPGITGLWQVRRTRAPGRDFQEWIRYDIEYVQRAGFLLDLSICVDTLGGILFGKGGARADRTAIDVVNGAPRKQNESPLLSQPSSSGVSPPCT